MAKRATGRRNWLRGAGAACLAAAALSPVAALAQGAPQSWPNRTVKIVVAIAAGSSGDTLARLLADRLEARWKQPVIVENRPGASGVIGTEYVAKATDGHTILLGSQSSILPKLTVKDLKFDPMTDLVPVYKVINYQLVLAASAETVRKADTLKKLVELSQSTSNGLFFAGAGPNAVFNLAMAVINKALNIKYTAVNFSNVGALNMAVLRNDAQFLLNTPSSFRTQIDSGEIRPLAAISAERYATLPDVPTLREAVGYDRYLPLLWAGFFVPRGTPDSVIDRLAKDTASLLEDDGVRRAIESRMTGSMVRSSPAEFAREIAEEMRVWSDVFAEAGGKSE